MRFFKRQQLEHQSISSLLASHHRHTSFAFPDNRRRISCHLNLMNEKASASVAHLSPQMAYGYKRRKPYPYYNYTALQEGWIRLVRIHQPQNETLHSNLDDDLHVSLHDYPLSSCPDYIALSYTWGEPSRPPDPTYQIFTQEPRCFPIRCGGYLLRGTRNLRTALRYLRWGQRIFKNNDAFNRITVNVEAAYQTLGSSRLLDLYWIDALCIDQDDLFERSTQVTYMGEIYKKASLCVIWLGERTDSTKSATKLIFELVQNNELFNAWTEIASLPTTNKISKFERVLSHIINKIPRKTIVELAIFLSHTWFSRIWVLQEAALAPKIALQYGPQFMDFRDLVTIGQYIGIAKGTIPLLADIGIETIESLGLQIPGRAGSFTEALRMLAMLGSVRRTFKEGKMPAFLDVMAMVGRSESTDPRYRIYGVLAITAEFQADLKHTIYPDYTSPAHVVYIKATSHIATRHNQLGFLNFVCQNHRKTIMGLPSWCPDYTNIEASLFPLGSHIDDGDYAMSLWGCQPDIEVLDERLLAVHGFCYDVVDRVAHNVKGLLALALDVARNDYSGYFERNGVDLLWRLLIRDEYQGAMPAPKVLGLYFPAMIGILMGVTDFPSTDKELNDWLHIITEMRSLEPESRPFLPDIDLMREAFDGGNSRNGNPEKSVLSGTYFTKEMIPIQRRAREAGLLSELRQLLGIGSADTPEIDLAHMAINHFKGNVFERLTKLVVDKCYFITRKVGRFGLGDSSSKTGDEVWILNGASKPVLLRPLENGNHVYIGASYVHGIMGSGIRNEMGTRKVRRVYIE
ncbi:heterokaryon incompatibility protein-domain-containing protein [Xylaria cubensis]|nr:heterokaryon incompatibility protein-domain-containing protein [Xylaria cubensis]